MTSFNLLMTIFCHGLLVFINVSKVISYRTFVKLVLSAKLQIFINSESLQWNPEAAPFLASVGSQAF